MPVIQKKSFSPLKSSVLLTVPHPFQDMQNPVLSQTKPGHHHLRGHSQYANMVSQREESKEYNMAHLVQQIPTGNAGGLFEGKRISFGEMISTQK